MQREKKERVMWPLNNRGHDGVLHKELYLPLFSDKGEIIVDSCIYKSFIFLLYND